MVVGVNGLAPTLGRLSAFARRSRINSAANGTTKATLFVYATRESPLGPADGRMSRLAGLFNRTMTYRTDSDIYFPSGMVLPKDPGSKICICIVAMNVALQNAQTR